MERRRPRHTGPQANQGRVREAALAGRAWHAGLRDVIRTAGKLAIAIAAVAVLLGCSGKFDYSKGAQLTGGNPEVGREKIIAHDCHSCHEIPGIPVNANRKGPDLKHWSRRGKIANNWPNAPENLEDYIRHPDRMMHGKSMKGEISMPSVSAEDAKNIAAYLYSIE